MVFDVNTQLRISDIREVKQDEEVKIFYIMLDSVLLFLQIPGTSLFCNWTV